MKPTVVIDSTTMSNTPGLNSGDWLKLLSLSQAGKICLIVPVLVLMEVGRQWQQKLEKDTRKLNDASESRIKSLTAVGIHSEQLNAEDAQLTRSYYVTHVSAKLMEQNAQVLHWPETSVEYLVNQDLDRRKPFSHNGKGLRDALIWETVRSCAVDADSAIYFITENNSDFLNDRNTGLHDDLLNSLNEEGCVHVIGNLGKLLEIDEIAELADQLQVNIEPFDRDFISDRIDEATQSLLYKDIAEVSGSYSPGGIWDPEIVSSLENPMFESIEVFRESLSWSTFDSNDPKFFVVEAQIDAECNLEGYIHKSDFRFYDCDDLNIIASDWNETMMLASENHNARFKFVAQVDHANTTNFEFDLDELELF